MKLSSEQLFKDPMLLNPTTINPGELRSGILVPVNSSANAFNSLEYALKLAKILHNTIHLFYVIDVDIDELSESTVVAHRVLERAFRKSENCVESLKEMIEESGTKVVTAQSRVGNIGLLIAEQVERLKPGMIVIGRDCFSKNTISNLIDRSPCPIITIPGSASPRLPSSIILANKQNTISEKTLDPLIKIIQKTTKELTILSFAKCKKRNDQNVTFPFDHTHGNVQLNYRQIEDPLPTNSVDDFVRANVVDLLCTIQQKRTLFNRIFQRSFPAEMVFRLKIPVMVMSEI